MIWTSQQSGDSHFTPTHLNKDLVDKKHFAIYLHSRILGEKAKMNDWLLSPKHPPLRPASQIHWKSICIGGEGKGLKASYVRSIWQISENVSIGVCDLNFATKVQQEWQPLRNDTSQCHLTSLRWSSTTQIRFMRYPNGWLVWTWYVMVVAAWPVRAPGAPVVWRKD